jgi:DNA polymerase-1
MKNTYIKVENEKQIDTLIKYCRKTGYASVDFETNGREFHHPLFYITTVSISFQPGMSYVIPLGHKDSIFKDRWVYIFKKIGKAIFEDVNIIKIAHNFKFEMLCARVYGIKFRGRLFDNMLAKYLLKEDLCFHKKSTLFLLEASLIKRQTLLYQQQSLSEFHS